MTKRFVLCGASLHSGATIPPIVTTAELRRKEGKKKRGREREREKEREKERERVGERWGEGVRQEKINEITSFEASPGLPKARTEKFLESSLQSDLAYTPSLADIK